MDPTDAEKLERLLSRHGGALVLYARQWTVMPEDVVQDALLQLVRQHREPENVVAWLYRAVRNGAISAARSEERRRRRQRLVASRSEPLPCHLLHYRMLSRVDRDSRLQPKTSHYNPLPSHS